ncbi:hypothetical protein ACFX11_036606 [Malus domestica]
MDRKRWLASWATASQFAVAVSLTSSQNDLQRLETEDENSILKKTKDAVITLRGVHEGKHDKEIDELLIKTSSLEMGGGQLSTKWLKVLP